MAGFGTADAAAIDVFLASKGSPMIGKGHVFVSEGNAARVDPYFIAAISGQETSYGTYGPSRAIRNPFGLGPGNTYPSYDAAIAAAARSIASYGETTVEGVAKHWAPVGASNDPGGLNGGWPTGVRSIYHAMTGHDPGAIAGPLVGTGAGSLSGVAGSTTCDGTPDTPIDAAGVKARHDYFIRYGGTEAQWAALKPHAGETARAWCNRFWTTAPENVRNAIPVNRTADAVQLVGQGAAAVAGAVGGVLGDIIEPILSFLRAGALRLALFVGGLLLLIGAGAIIYREAT